MVGPTQACGMDGTGGARQRRKGGSRAETLKPIESTLKVVHALNSNWPGLIVLRMQKQPHAGSRALVQLPNRKDRLP